MALAGRASRQSSASRQTRAITVAVLGALLVARLADALSTSQPAGQAAFVVALFLLPFLYTVPAARRLIDRYRWPVLAGQAVLSFVPYAVFGAQWTQGVTGLLAALVLLMLPGRLSWPLAGLLLLADVGLRAGPVGLPWAPAWSAVLWVALLFVDECLAVFGLIRLVDLAGQVQAARAEVAGLAVARERQQAATDLQAALGERLASIAGLAAAAQHALASDAAAARGHIAAAGVTAREAVARARAVLTEQRRPVEGPAGAPGEGPAGAAVAPRLAWVIVVVLLCGFEAQTLNNLYLDHFTAATAVATVLGSLGALVLQLHHSWGVRYGGRPRAWPVTLALQTVLVFVPFMLVPARYSGGLVGFAAGSFLLLVPGWWRWAGYAGVVGTWTLLFAVVPETGPSPPASPANDLYVLAANAGIGLLVYALTWLAEAARQLAVLRAELAGMAAAAERLRVARDVHDLLGLGLSAIALKTDLIGRLIGRDDSRAAAEITETSRLCAAARADIRLVTDAGQAQTLAAECAAARDILSSAGVRVELDVLAAVPAGADSVLAPVLREAVTNILRHSAATACTIRAVASGGGLRLDISNDGAPAAAAGTAAGRGLANLAARVHAAGGRLTAGQHGARFELSAEIPLPGQPQPDQSQPDQALPGPAQPGQAQPDQAGRPAGSR